MVLIIAPWNFPIGLLIEPAIAAIAAGNSVILKPSEVTGKIGQLLGDLMPKYMDSSMIRVINGGVKETTELLKHKFDFIFYTGSNTVGKIIMSAASKHLTPVALELGGKNPVFMDDTITNDIKLDPKTGEQESNNLEIALKRIFWGRWLMNTGQICLAPEYIVISKKNTPLCVKYLQKFIKQWLVDNNEDKQVEKSEHYGRIVNQRHFDRLNKIRQHYLKKYPKHIVIGNENDDKPFERSLGQADRDSRYMPPMVLNISLDELESQSDACEIMKDEVFGPFLTIISCDEAGGSAEWKSRMLKIIDSSKMNEKYHVKEPLACYVFSHDKKFINYFEERIAAGSVIANDVIMHFALKNFPFGGKGASGMGHYHTNCNFDTFTDFKPCAETGYRSEFINGFRYPGADLTQIEKTIPKELKEKPSLLRRVVYGAICGGFGLSAGYGLYQLYGKQVQKMIGK